MKYLLILLVLLIPLSLHADDTADVIARKNVVSPCPTYYASAILSWDGNHTSGILYGCNSAGAAILFTDHGADIATQAGAGCDGNCMKLDDAGEDITLQQSVGQYYDETADQTICFRTKVTAVLDADVQIFTAFDADGDDGVYSAIRNPADNDISSSWQVETGTDGYQSGAAMGFNTWEIIASSWGAATNPNGGLSANGGEQATWSTGWSTGATIDDAMTDRPIYLRIGSIDNDPGDTEIIYIDELYLFAGEKVDCSLYLTRD